MSRFLVTGASGFIGRRLCAELREHGDVVALVRRSATGPWDEMHVCDLASDSPPDDAVSGAQSVFHLAGRAHVLDERVADEDAFHRANVEATERVCEAASGAGVRRLVLASSVSAMGEGGDAPVPEDKPPDPQTAYGRSKRDAEKVVLERMDEPVVLRFPLVYGPRLKGNLERAYRVPNFDELYFNEGSLRGNPSLNPEESWNADGGVQLGFDEIWIFDDISVEVVGFHNEIEDSIVFQLVSLNVIAATNTGDATVTGVELAGAFRLFDWIEFSGNYTRLDSEDERTKESLPGRADEEHLLRLAIGPSDGLFKLVGERQYTSSIPVRSGGTSKLPGRTIYNASFTFDFAKLRLVPERWRLGARRLALSVIGTNLDDRSVRDALGFPQPGRTLLFQAEAAW
jgi:hypothetical protein